MNRPVRTLDKKALYRLGVAMRRDGRLHDFSDPAMEEVFTGSIDRFSDIAWRLRECPKVLDIGSGHVMLVSFLSELGHECHAGGVSRHRGVVSQGPQTPRRRQEPARGRLDPARRHSFAAQVPDRLREKVNLTPL